MNQILFTRTAASLATLFVLLLTAGEAWAGTRILFLGDSLTAGLGVDREQAWPSLVGERLKAMGRTDLTLVNGSISGSTTASAPSRLTWHLRARPDILVLALGANDGLRGLPNEAMKDNLDKTIRLAKANGMEVILAGMEVPPNYGAAYAREFRRVFRDLAQSHGLRFIPFLLQGVAGRPEFNQADGIHPNPEGHRVIAELVLPVLLEAL
jgi:acyl-CoA thioesterase-1